MKNINSGPSKIEFWLERNDKKFFYISRVIWSIALAITLPTSLLLSWTYGPHMLWIFGGSMIVATTIIFLHVLLNIWCEGQLAGRKHGNRAG